MSHSPRRFKSNLFPSGAGGAASTAQPAKVTPFAGVNKGVVRKNRRRRFLPINKKPQAVKPGVKMRTFDEGKEVR